MAREKGSALVYILIAIALLAALTASFMQPASQQTSSQNIVKTVSDIRSQSELIRSAIQECILIYPQGDRAQVHANSPYPLSPTDAYLTDEDATNLVRYIRCPGDAINATYADHNYIFGASSGKFLQPPPDLFEEWEYYSGTDGVFFFTRTSKTDSFLTASLERLDEDFSECEADVITVGATAVEMTSTEGVSDPKCPANNQCFRLWMIAKPTATYQAGSPEASECP